MRIPASLKTVIGILLPLLLLAGCMTPSNLPTHAPEAAEGSVRISLRMPQTGYQAQHLLTDIKSLVFGLVDVSNTPYFGYADGADLPESAAGNRYHVAIAGDGSPSSGLLTGNGLNEGQWAQTQRYLYVSTNNTGSRSMTFDNIKPSAASRYVAFVAAFGKDATQTTVAKGDVLGFAQSAAFPVLEDGSTHVPPLTMTLDRGLGSMKVFLDIDQTTENVALNTMSRLVVAFVDVSAPETRTPHLGYQSQDGATTILSGAEAYHQAIAGLRENGDFTQGRFSYLGTPLSLHADRGNHARFLYHVDTTTLSNTAQREIRFNNLKAGGNYRVFAGAFSGGDAYANSKGTVQSGELTITDGQEASTYLQLTLTD